MKKIIIPFVGRFIRPIIKWYVSRPTNYRYEGIRVIVLPGVFHPQFFFSTKLLVQYLKKIVLKNRSFLELGAGSGLISLFAAKQGANVTASDISSISITNIKQNLELNRLNFPVIHSDLFDKIPNRTFDIIVINPPYYKKNPATEAEHAWYCGENSEYFTKLFSSIGSFINEQSQIIMVLSDVCDIDIISSIAMTHQYELVLSEKHSVLLENNFIYQLRKQLS